MGRNGSIFCQIKDFCVEPSGTTTTTSTKTTTTTTTATATATVIIVYYYIIKMSITTLCIAGRNSTSRTADCIITLRFKIKITLRFKFTLYKDATSTGKCGVSWLVVFLG